MIILEDILSQEIVQRLGWTLLHFIWQAVAVALLLIILLRLLRKSTAKVRYIFACLALALIVLLPIITFNLVHVSHPLTAANLEPAPAPTVLSAVEMPAPETIVIAEPSRPESVTVVPSVHFKQRVVDTLEPALPYVVAGWLIGVFSLSIWNLGGWAQLHRLKRRMVKQVDSTLQNRLKLLAQKLKVKQTVHFVESAIVQIPTVVGWLRPVILLPASALTGLSTEQLEAILAHELAHIKRYDYLVNILQTIVETLGFYHPAVWWISHKTRAERENCCDDMAVSISGDRVSYAGALASMEEIRAAGGKLAVAASGGNLFRRICRLLGKDSADNTGLSWVPAATAILLIIALTIPTTLALTNKYAPEQTASKVDNNKFLPITCTGRIIDRRGNNVASAMVEAYEMYFDKAGNIKMRLIGKSVTKDYGKFSFKTTPTVKKNRSADGLVIAQKEGLAIGWANWPLYDGNKKNKITLQEPTKLSGRIVDENDKPIPNAEVRAALFEDKTFRDGNVSWLPGIHPFEGLSIHTDRNGQFEFDNIPKNATCDLLVTAPGCGTIYSRKPDRIEKGYEWAEYKADQTDIRITLSPEARIEGKLVDNKTGKGKSGITLRVVPYFTPVYFERYLCTTQRDGKFSIGGLRTGRYVIMRAGSRNLKVDVDVESGKRTRNVILKYPDDVRKKIYIENVKPDKIRLKLVDTNSRPVVGAWVGNFVDWSDIAENPPVWFLNDGESYNSSEVESAAKIISNDEGKIILTKDELFKPQWPAEQKVPISAIDEGHYLAGLRELSRDDLGTEVTLMLQPGCRVHGRVSAVTARKRKWSTKMLTVYVRWQEHMSCQYTSKQGRFEFVLPPGKYKVMVYSEDPEKAEILPILIKPGQRDLDLTEYIDGKRKLPSEQNYIQAENDINATSQNEESPAGKNPPAIVLAKSIDPLDEDIPCVLVDCFVVELSPDTKIDSETLTEARKILGSNISYSNSKIDVIMNAAVEAMNASKDKSIENKRLTKDRYKAFMDMLTSKGYIKILMNPKIETLNGRKATIMSSQKVPLAQAIKATPDGGKIIRTLNENEYVKVVDLIEITPHVSADGNIMLEVKADFGSQDTSVSEKTASVPSRQFATRMLAHPGEILIMGGFIENHPAPGNTANNTVKQAKELLLILIPTIMTPPANLNKITEKQIEGYKRELSNQNLKKLGLAVAMYADDNDENLPESIQELKPYIRDENIFDWILDNVEYFDKGNTAQRNAHFILIAYDSKLPEKADGTNVLFLDFSVRFLDTKEFEKLDFKRARILIETWFLAVNKDFIQNIDQNADSANEAKELIKLKPMLLTAVDGPDKLSFIPPEHNIDLLLKAVRDHKDSKVLASPQVFCLEDKTAKIEVMNREYYYLKGYTEPKDISEEHKKWLDKVEEGVKLSLKPNLTPNNKIIMQFESEIAQYLDSEESKSNGKAQYNLPKVQRNTQTSTYRAENGQTLLFGPYKIADYQDEQNKQNYLLILIRANIIGSSEQDKSAQAKNLIETKPTIIQTRTDRPKDDEQEKTKPASEHRRRRGARSTDDSLAKIDNQKQVIQILFKLKHYNASQMTQIVRPVLTKTGHVSTDEKTNSLIVIDTAENLKRIEKIIAQYDVDKSDKTVTEIFEIRYGDPVEIAELLKKLINGRPENGAIIEKGKEPIVLIPEPVYKWIIAKGSAENMRQISDWIKKLDISKTTMGLDPIDKAVHEQLEIIVDLSDLAPGMSFGEVIEKLENSVEPPLQIQPIWKDLLENAEVEQATPAGMDPLPHIKLRKALEILLTSVTSTQLGEFGELTYIVDQGVILIGTEKILPPKMGSHVYDTSDLLGTDATKASPENMLKIAEQIKERDVPLDVDRVKPRIIELQNSDAEQMVELLKTLLTKESKGALNIKDILIDRGIKVNQKIVGPLCEQLTFEEVPGTNKLIVISRIPEAYDVIEEFISDLDRQNVSPENMKQISQWIEKLDTDKTTMGLDPIDKAVYEQLETIVDLSDLAPEMSFSEVIEKLENSVDPPLQIQPIWKDLLENAEVEQATPAGMDPLPRVKLRKALEILLTSVSSTGLPKPIYVVDEGVILIETSEMLPPNQTRSSQVKAKITKLLEETEKPMTPLEQIQKQLDELLKQQKEAPKVTEPNVFVPQAPLISNIFIDTPILDTLKYIADEGNVTIIPDETIKGLISCKLKDVTVEESLDIVLAGTPYVWKKTPYYYLVASEAGPSEFIVRMESAKKLSDLGKTLLIYANDHDDKYPNSLFTLSEYMKWQDFSWVRKNVEYLASGKTPADPPDTPIAYDKTLLSKGKGTNVLYNDCHVSFEKAQELKKLGISESEIMIETQLWSVTDDFLKDVGLDANFEDFSHDWRGHLAATYPAGPNGKPYGLMIDDLHLTFLLRAIQSNDDSKAIVAPRILTREGTTAEMRFLTEEYNYISGYVEPQDPSSEPQPKRDKVDIGTCIWVTPELSGKNVNLDFKLEITQLKGIIEGKYRGKYPTYKPIVDVISMNLPCTIPNGNTMLIGGLKINEHVTKKPGALKLKDLPLIGAAFNSNDKIKDQKMLLILVKPITNPQQKATKVLPGQEDSEEDIRRLAEQLDKKLKRPTN